MIQCTKIKFNGVFRGGVFVSMFAKLARAPVFVCVCVCVRVCVCVCVCVCLCACSE